MELGKDQYLSINQEYTGEFKDRGSKFIAYLFPIDTIESFSSKLKELKSKYLKARHHCYAYRLLDNYTFRYNDDGEPSGTAGKPIYNQILSHEIKNVACVVVRYFGGVKLGTSGLINAYKTATTEAIAKSEILVYTLEVIINIDFHYSHMGSLMKAVKTLKLNIANKSFDDKAQLSISVNQSEVIQNINKIKASMLNRSIEDITEETKIEGLNFVLRK